MDSRTQRTGTILNSNKIYVRELIGHGATFWDIKVLNVVEKRTTCILGFFYKECIGKIRFFENIQNSEGFLEIFCQWSIAKYLLSDCEKKVGGQSNLFNALY